jgi:hypothetical protein
MDTPVSPIDRLLVCAAEWVASDDSGKATFARLGREVVNDGGFIPRIERPGASTTTATLEKFARYFIDPVNWPVGRNGIREVPQAAIEFAHVMGVSPADRFASPDNDRSPIGTPDADTAGFPVSRGAGSPAAGANAPGAAAGESFTLTAPEVKVA